ncbi:transglycosylase domain-containing protein [Bacillus sp. KH172YL63]|uniref:transglycosylase domain-containing protein n=1 Tax=Bacillus sp. KH172YL63 TaxID=2709784 RepID=UPI0013E48A62|nr:PBP1A family penicillin-binding protein [Bacillus sp. KH172YL63]BCB04494.1 penicillin-binding protein 1A/1B [Bacillus sp. KH172YL63]
MAGQYKSREEKRLAQQKSKSKKSNRKGSMVKRVIISLFIIGIIGMLAGAGLFAYYASSAPKLDEKLLKDPIASEIYDMNGDLITTVGKEKREYANFDDIPQVMQDAVLATEDNRFYKHNGIDLIRLGGAVIANVTGGFGSEGASTITQQVIKGSFLSPEKTLKRKAQEAWLALKLEQEYTKEEIFEMYFNKVYMSAGINGMATAADYYYGKDIQDIKLHEAALIAGLPQSPNNYNPFKFPEKAEKRRNIVLSLMAQHGKISEKEKEAAQAIPITEGLVSAEDIKEKSSDKYPAFVDAVIDEVQDMGDYNLFSDGLKVYTTVDPNAQKRLEEILAGEATSFNYPEAAEEPMQAGVTLLDTKTGEIRAIGGGREQDPEVKRGFNYAIDSKRQPGSTIKPLLDYAPAIEHLKWSTYHILKDEPYKYSNGTELNNYDGRFKGPITIREGLWDSRNITALKAFQEVGPEKAEDFVNGLGLKFDHYYESASIGGVTPGVNSVQMAGAYAAFGNEGIYNKPHTVSKVILRDGETEIKHDEKPQPAMKEYTAYMISDMLQSVIDHPQGTGKFAKVPGLPMAGKSGTTNYSEKEREKYGIAKTGAPDSWFVGYTTNYTAAVWTGYKTQSIPLSPTDRRVAQYIVSDLMSYVHDGVDTPDFHKPDSVVESKVEIGSNPPRLPSEYTPDDRIITELFVRGTEPSKVSKEYDKIDSPSNLKGKFNKKDQTITLGWDYGKGKDVTFEVSVSINGEAKQVLTTTDKKGLNVENIQSTGAFMFEVVAISGDQRSNPASVTVEVKAEKDDEDNAGEENEGNNEDGNGNDQGNENGQDNENEDNSGGEGGNSGGDDGTAPPEGDGTGSDDGTGGSGGDTGGNTGTGSGTGSGSGSGTTNGTPATQSDSRRSQE